MELSVPNSGLLIGDGAGAIDLARAISMPEVGSGTQETRGITGWNPQIQLSLCLHGYYNPLS